MLAPHHHTKTFYAISVAMQLGFLILIPVAAFLWLGAYIDDKTNTSPLFLLIGLVIGFSTTAYSVFHLLQPLLKEDSHAKH